MAPKRGKAPPAEPKRGKAAAPPPEPAEPKRGKAAAPPPAPAPAEDYSTWSAPKLKEKLKEIGASTSGSKDILAERLATLQAAKASGAAPAKAAPAEPQPKAAADRSPPKRKADEDKPEPRAKAKAEAKAEPKGKKRDAAGEQKTDEPEAPPANLTAPSQVYFEDGEFKVDYAKSDKSTCKKCMCKIAKDTLRIGKMMASDKFDGKYPVWMHATCFFMAGLLPRTVEMIDGFSMLKLADQEEIKKHIPSGGGGIARSNSKDDLMQDQNKKIFEVQEMLGELKDSELKEMLALNGYPTKKLDVGLKEVCADGIIFGACGHCEACDDSERNIFVLAGDAYVCRGWVDEFLKCTNRTQDPKRTKWQLTEAVKKVADGKLGKMKLTTGTRVFAKPLSEGPATSASVSSDPAKKPPFLGLVIVLSRTLESSVRDELAKLVSGNGGMLADSVTKATTFVVSEAKDERGEDEAKAEELSIPGVSRELLDESVEQQELQEMDAHLLWGEARRRKDVKEKTSSKFKEKRGVKIDTDVGDLFDTAHVLVDKQARVVYSEMLTKSDLDSGANSFYTLHLLESDDLQGDGSHHYYVFRKWGRIGSDQGGTKMEKFESNKDKAIKAFTSQYLDKSGNTFGHKPNDFVAKHGKMLRVSLEHKALCKTNQQSSDQGDAGGDDDGGNNDQPLGKLSKDQILQGDAVLDKVEALLKEGGEASGAKAANQLKSLTNRYYSYIPHNFGSSVPPIINNEELLGTEKAMLQFYLRMGFEEVGDPDEQLTPISGLMQLDLPKTLVDACKGIPVPGIAGPIKQCTNKGAQLAKKKAGSPLQEMDQHLYGSILLYTANAIYQQLNKALRDEDRKLVESYFPYLRMLFEACGRLEQKKRTLWRGLGVDLYPTYKVGNTITWWGVSSCTSEEKVARNFMAGCGDGATFLHIETTTACEIAEVSFYANEAESLLMPGTQLEVIKSERKGKQSEIWLREVGREVN